MVLKLDEENQLNQSTTEKGLWKDTPQLLDVGEQTIETLATCEVCFLPASLPCVSTAAQQCSGQSRVWLGITASMECMNLTTQSIVPISQEKPFLAFSKHLFQQQHYASAKGYPKKYILYIANQKHRTKENALQLDATKNISLPHWHPCDDTQTQCHLKQTHSKILHKMINDQDGVFLCIQIVIF